MQFDSNDLKKNKGLYLTGNDPARFVAAFNALSDEARELTRFGYAALEATKKFRSK